MEKNERSLPLVERVDSLWGPVLGVAALGFLVYTIYSNRNIVKTLLYDSFPSLVKSEHLAALSDEGRALYTVWEASNTRQLFLEALAAYEKKKKKESAAEVSSILSAFDSAVTGSLIVIHNADDYAKALAYFNDYPVPAQVQKLINGNLEWALDQAALLPVLAPWLRKSAQSWVAGLSQVVTSGGER